MNLNESILKIDGLDSLSLIKSGVYKDTYHCMYKGKMRSWVITEFRKITLI